MRGREQRKTSEKYPVTHVLSFSPSLLLSLPLPPTPSHRTSWSRLAMPTFPSATSAKTLLSLSQTCSSLVISCGTITFCGCHPLTNLTSEVGVVY